LTETVDNALGLAGQAVQLSSDERERISALTALGDDFQAGFRGDDGRHHYQEALRLARGDDALAAERARLCAKLAYMAMVPGSFRRRLGDRGVYSVPVVSAKISSAIW